MITFEDIKKANETINTTNIKGKEYAEVNQRIKAFRMVYPEGTIETNMISNENGICIFKASVYAPIYQETSRMVIDNTPHISIVEDKILLGTGTAYEKENSTFINKTSYIENCETSAVGRALGMAGFGIDTSVASAEEVQNAIQQQDDMKPITTGNITILQNLIKTLPDAKVFYDEILYKYSITDLAQLTTRQYGEILTEIKRIKGE